MVSLHPQFIGHKKKKEWAILPYEDLVALQKWIDEAQDTIDMLRAKQETRNSKFTPLEKIKLRFPID